MTQKWRFFFAAVLVCFSCISAYAEDPGVEAELQQLEELKEMGAISQEEYEFLLSSLKGVDEQGLYTLVVNKRRMGDFYRTKHSNGKTYLPVTAFFDLIGHSNYHKGAEKLFIYLENDKDMVLIDLADNSVSDRDKKKIKIIEGENYIAEGDEIYLEQELFASLFFDKLEIDSQKLEIIANPAFQTLGEQKLSLNIQQDKLEDEKDKEEVVYTNSRKFFELGYLRTDLMWYKQKGDSHVWESKLEYEGAFLWGDLKTSYDVKENEMGDTSIRYFDIWKGHTLDVWRYSNLEKGFSFRKDKGYYWNGKRYIIKESVPIGSTVELQYMGATIDIQTADNGEVIFDNDDIRENRSYTLRIFTPSGEVFLRPIQTLKDYNQQAANEIEYDINVREDRISGKYKSDFEVFYGISNNLTLGAAFQQTPELTDDNSDTYKYLDEGQLELIYNDRIGSYPYVLSTSYGRAFNLYDNKSSYDILGEIDIGNWTLSTGLERFGNYYDEKVTRDFEITYNPPSFYSIGYQYLYQEYYDDDSTEENRLKLSLSQSYKDFLGTLNYNVSSLSAKDEFGLNLYYRGFDNFSLIFNNTWYNSFDDYEAKLSLSNNDYYGPLDYSFEIRYSEKYKGTLGIKFEMKLDDWFKVGAYTDKDSKHAIGIGIDRTFDLKNISSPIESMDTSRVKVTAFLDRNNNNIFDEGDELLEDVKVKIGSQELTTDGDGIAYFYGVPNSIKYSLAVEPPRPTHTIGNIKHSVNGHGKSTIEALIPIKSFKDFIGTIVIDDSLDLDDGAREKIYTDIIVKIKNSKGKIVEITSPDEIGDFHVNGLLEDSYDLSITYNGKDFSPEEFKKEFKVTDEPVIFNFNGETITEE